MILAPVFRRVVSRSRRKQPTIFPSFYIGKGSKTTYFSQRKGWCSTSQISRHLHTGPSRQQPAAEEVQLRNEEPLPPARYGPSSGHGGTKARHQHSSQRGSDVHRQLRSRQETPRGRKRSETEAVREVSPPVNYTKEDYANARKLGDQFSSPHHYTHDFLMSCYQQYSTEELDPEKIGEKQIKWAEQPLRYVRDGLDMLVVLQSKVIIVPGREDVAHRVTAKLEWGGMKVAAVGDGETKELAANNAVLHALLRLRDSPVLRSAYLSAQYPPIRSSVVDENLSAKLDVYDYAAQLNSLPAFNIERAQVTRTFRGKLGYVCTITLPDTDSNVKGVGLHPTSQLATEIAASLDFKKSAEEEHKRTSSNAEDGAGKLLVKGFDTLTSQTGVKFVQYYKMKRNIMEHFRFEGRNGRGGGVHGILYLGESRLSETYMPSFKSAELICYYLAAREIKARNPDLWASFNEYMVDHYGEILRKVPPVWVRMDMYSIGCLRNTLTRLKEIETEIEAYAKVKEKYKSKAGKEEAEVEVEQELGDLRRGSGLRVEIKDPGLRARKNVHLSRALETYETDAKYEKMRAIRAELPLNQYKEDVKKVFRDNDVCVLVGATGSGKTTQVPQFLLDEAIREGNGAECNVVCTQPRRIAATSVAARVAAERGEALGESVGFRVRFNAKPPQAGGSITYCTTGILLRLLQEGPTALNGVTHVIVDEVHERDIQIDFLMVLLKRILGERKKNPNLPQIKVILMSATIDTTLFRKYFGQGKKDGECAYIEIPGRLFPVEKHYLNDIQTILRRYPQQQLAELNKDQDVTKYMLLEEDFKKKAEILPVPKENSAEDKTNRIFPNQDRNGNDDAGIDWQSTGSFWEQENQQFLQEDQVQPTALIGTLIAHLCKSKDEGAVLVFLPGMSEIQEMEKAMRNTRLLGLDFNDTSKYRIFCLHSSIPTMQQEVFEPLPEGMRKIILSTNIAETSVTIPEVVFVIDTCKHREKRYSQLRRMSSLVLTWISQSSAKQRQGRAGRVRPGEYYALIYPERHAMLPVGDTPEIMRSDLQEICLDVRAFGMKEPIAEVLQECIQPPGSMAVAVALKALRNMDALDNNEKLTSLGKVLASLPVQPSLGKMVLLGAIFKCIDPILILAALEATREFFLNPPGETQRAQEIRQGFASGSPSDHFAALNAFREWRYQKYNKGKQHAQDYAYENLMHNGGLTIIENTAEQMYDLLVQAGLVPKVLPEQRYICELGNQSLNKNSDVPPLISALLCAGLAPNLGVQMNGLTIQTATDPKALIHPSSVNGYKFPKGQAKRENSRPKPVVGPPGTLITFSTKSGSSNGTFLKNTTVISPMSSMLFTGRLKKNEEDTEGATVILDNWLPFKVGPTLVDLVLKFQGSINDFLARTFQRLGGKRRGGPYTESLLDGDAASTFFDADATREPLVKGVVEILERTHHTDALARKAIQENWERKERLRINEVSSAMAEGARKRKHQYR